MSNIKLTKEQIIEIEQSKLSREELSKLYNITENYVYVIQLKKKKREEMLSKKKIKELKNKLFFKLNNIGGNMGEKKCLCGQKFQEYQEICCFCGRNIKWGSTPVGDYYHIQDGTPIYYQFYDGGLGT
jgi:hypothetical protein